MATDDRSWLRAAIDELLPYFNTANLPAGLSPFSGALSGTPTMGQVRQQGMKDFSRPDKLNQLEGVIKDITGRSLVSSPQPAPAPQPAPVMSKAMPVPVEDPTDRFLEQLATQLSLVSSAAPSDVYVARKDKSGSDNIQTGESATMPNKRGTLSRGITGAKRTTSENLGFSDAASLERAGIPQGLSASMANAINKGGADKMGANLAGILEQIFGEGGMSAAQSRSDDLRTKAAAAVAEAFAGAGLRADALQILSTLFGPDAPIQAIVKSILEAQKRPR